jgi:hypothetical protein
MAGRGVRGDGLSQGRAQAAGVRAVLWLAGADPRTKTVLRQGSCERVHINKWVLVADNIQVYWSQALHAV